MAQNTVFSQLIKLIPRTQFQSWVHKYDGDRHVRSLDCWTWFGSLLFGQMTGHDSIRAIERVFSNSEVQLKKHGFSTICRSTLSDANHSRPVEILEEAFAYLLKKAKASAPCHGFRFKGDIFAMDASVIKLCIGLSPWAKYKYDYEAAVKLHTAIDLRGDLPTFAVVREALVHDVVIAKEQTWFQKGATVIFDKAYLNYKWFNELNQAGVFFITRPRKTMTFKVAECRDVDRTRGHLCDQTIYINTWRKSQYRGRLRRISYRDPDTGKKLVFLTNRFDLSTQTICDLYKARWKVELFFKTLKQHLKIKKFLGTSIHAVKAQIWVALIAYLMIQIWRFYIKTNISIPDAMAVVGTLLLLKQPLSKLLGLLPRASRAPPELQLKLFT